MSAADSRPTILGRDHWQNNVDNQYWMSLGIPVRTNYDHGWWNTDEVNPGTIYNCMSGLQRKLMIAAKCNKHEMTLTGGIHQWRRSSYMTPFHPDVLPHWGKKDISLDMICPIPSCY